MNITKELLNAVCVGTASALGALSFDIACELEEQGVCRFYADTVQHLLDGLADAEDSEVLDVDNLNFAFDAIDTLAELQPAPLLSDLTKALEVIITNFEHQQEIRELQKRLDANLLEEFSDWLKIQRLQKELSAKTERLGVVTAQAEKMSQELTAIRQAMQDFETYLTEDEADNLSNNALY